MTLSGMILLIAVMSTAGVPADKPSEQLTCPITSNDIQSTLNRETFQKLFDSSTRSSTKVTSGCRVSILFNHSDDSLHIAFKTSNRSGHSFKVRTTLNLRKNSINNQSDRLTQIDYYCSRASLCTREYIEYLLNDGRWFSSTKKYPKLTEKLKNLLVKPEPIMSNTLLQCFSNDKAVNCSAEMTMCHTTAIGIQWVKGSCSPSNSLDTWVVIYSSSLGPQSDDDDDFIWEVENTKVEYSCNWNKCNNENLIKAVQNAISSVYDVNSLIYSIESYSDEEESSEYIDEDEDSSEHDYKDKDDLGGSIWPDQMPQGGGYDAEDIDEDEHSSEQDEGHGGNLFPDKMSRASSDGNVSKADLHHTSYATTIDKQQSEPVTSASMPFVSNTAFSSIDIPRIQFIMVVCGLLFLFS